MYFAADPEADDLMNKDNDREQHLNEDKPSEREKQHSSFEPDLDYDYVYDQDLSCMVYNGPDFEVGEIVDAMKTENSIRTETIQCWEQAKVTDDTGDKYIIEFLRDDDSSIRMIDKRDYRTMMFKAWTHTRENRWRYETDRLLNLLVEYYSEEMNNWVVARVTSTMTNMSDTIDQVVIQTLPEPDNMTDDKNSEYPQISIRSPLLRLPEGPMRKYQSSEIIELGQLNQTYSYPIGPEPKLNYTGPYSLKSQAKDQISIIIQLKEYFVEIGCHTLIIERIADVKHSIRIPTLMELIVYVEGLIEFIKFQEDKSDYMEFSQGFIKALEVYMFEGGLEKSIKEMQYGFFGTIFNVLRDLHGFTNEDKLVKVNILLEAANKCLISDFLSIRVHGIKEIEKRCTGVFRAVWMGIKNDDLGEWMSKNNIINEIFGINHHSELISRSEYILKVLSKSKTGIKEHEHALIWNLSKRDQQTKKEIYALLQKVGDTLDKGFIEYIMERIKELDHLSNTDLEFLYSFKNKTDFQVECTWKILNDSANYSEEIVNTAFDKLVDITKYATISKKLATMHHSINKLKAHDTSLIFIKVLKATFNHTNLSTARVQNMTEDFENAKDELLTSFYQVRNYILKLI
jgi:hypothetical protein